MRITGKLDEKKQNLLFVLSLAVLSLAAFLLVGSDKYVLFADSRNYIQMKTAEGVMPLYPLFLFFNRLLWGTERFLDMVVIEQALIGAVCVIWFVMEIRKRFSLKYWESYLAYLLALFPFTTDMPEAMTTQEILTEGLTYALFYVFFIFLLGALLEKNWKKLAVSFLLLFPLSLMRSQLQILFAVCGVAVLYLGFMKYERKKRLLFIGRMLLSLMICGLVMGAGVLGVVKLNAVCQKAIFGDGALAQLVRENEISDEQLMQIGVIEKKQEDVETTGAEGEKGTVGAETAKGQNGLAVTAETEGQNGTVGAAGTEEMKEQQEADADRPAPNTAPEVIAFMNQEYEDSGVSVSQYDSLLFSKGMYEADYEDCLLFEDEQVREQFLLAYGVIDELEYRYPYADTGLWGWRDISNAVGGIGARCFSELNKYFAEYYNTTVVYFTYRCTGQAFRTIGLKLLTHHFGSFVLHTLRLMPPAFIATVFFQKEQFYLLCHLITLFLYVSAIGLMIWSFADKKAERKYAEFMFSVMLVDFIMVIALSLVFVGLQRYLVYAFGIFYIAYLLLLRQLWHVRGRRLFEWWKKRKTAKQENKYGSCA